MAIEEHRLNSVTELAHTPDVLSNAKSAAATSAIGQSTRLIAVPVVEVVCNKMAAVSKKRKHSAIHENDIADESDEEISNQQDPLSMAETERRSWHICDFTHCLPPIAGRTAERIMASIVAIPPSYCLDMRDVERMAYPNTAHYDVKQMASLGLLQKSAKIYTAIDKVEKAVDGLHVANNFWLFQLGALYKAAPASDHDKIRHHLCPQQDKTGLKKFGETLRKALRVVYTLTVPSTCYKNLSEEALRQVLAWSKQHYCPRNIRHPNKAVRWEAGVLLGCEESEDAGHDFTDPDDSRDSRDIHHSKYINSVSEDVLDYVKLGRPDRYVVRGPMRPQGDLLSEIIVIEDD
ncbi:hypothetical protein RI367_006372 [Sorochytrium milnesiophthora]